MVSIKLEVFLKSENIALYRLKPKKTLFKERIGSLGAAPDKYITKKKTVIG